HLTHHEQPKSLAGSSELQLKETELPGYRVEASRRGHSWHIRWPKSPLPHRMSRSRLTPARFSTGRATPCKKNVESAVEFLTASPPMRPLKLGPPHTDGIGSLLTRC